jgi:hypothetical protein
MANDRPAEGVGSVGFDDLIPIARRLNTASDDLNVALKGIEDRLNQLGLGIARFVPIPSMRKDINDGEDHEPEEFYQYQVGYDRLGDGWALMTRRAHFIEDPTMTADSWEFDQEKPLLRSSRELRMEAAAVMPELLKSLKEHAEEILQVVDTAGRLAGTGKRIDFEFGETAASNAFWDRNPKFFAAFMRLMDLTNKTFGREWKPANRMQDIGFNLGETCRQDLLEIAFLAVNGHGIGAQKLLRGLYERAVTLEYIRRNPEKAERFVRYAAIQEHKASKVAVDLVGRDAFDDAMGQSFADVEEMYIKVKPEFEVTDCKKCQTKRTAISWDIDLASMVKKLGEPYQSQYLMAYAIPTMHIHASLASAFSRESVGMTPDQRRVHDAELALISATLIFVLVIRSQSEIFSLGFDPEIKSCWEDVTDVWRDRPHSPRALVTPGARA